jgi:hypothetical protein
MPTSESAFVRPANFAYPFEDEDAFVPEGTWISDFVESMRGIETPTLFCLWGALWALSAATVRKVGLAWLDGEPLYPNLYVFLVSIAGRCHKTTTVRHAFKVLHGLRAEFTPHAMTTLEEAELYELVDFNWVTSKTTPESFERILVEDTPRMLRGVEGMAEMRRGAQLTVCAGQLDTFLNKRKYTVGLTETLTQLYDCNDYETLNTKSAGTVELRDVYATLIGAITPDEVKESLPDEAHSDGFMSRVSVVFKNRTLRCFPHPEKTLPGFPTIKDLSRKLAYLLRRGRSIDYVLDAEAAAWYDAWYRRWKHEIDADESYLERTGENRYDVLLLRVALLVRFARYDAEGFIVQKRDLEAAIRILDGTFKESVQTKQSFSTREGFARHYATLLGYIRRNGETFERRKVIQYMSSKGVASRDVDIVLRQLEEEGVIQCATAKSEKKAAILYRVVGKIAEPVRSPVTEALQASDSTESD